MTTQRRLPGKRAEAGFSLIVAMVIFMLLLVLGTMAMQSMNTEQDLAYADKEAQTALYVAEAGAAWATDQLAIEPYSLGAEDVNDRKPEQILNGTPVDDAVACPNSEPACVALDWFLLDAPTASSVPLSGTSFGGHGVFQVYGSYEVVGSSWIIRIRTLGTTSAGAKRMLEIKLGPSS